MLPNRSLEVIAQAIGERNENLSPSVRVRVLRDGLLDSGLVDGSVVLSLIPDPVNPYPGQLAGSLAAQVNAGQALFGPLSVDVPGPYTLRATTDNSSLIYVNGSSSFWRLSLPGSPVAGLLDPTIIGYWINITGTGIPFGIWAKIIDVRTSQGNYWILEQPKNGPTQLNGPPPAPPPLSGVSQDLSIRINGGDPRVPPAIWTGIGSHVWFLWNPLGGELIQPFNLEPLEPADETLITDVPLEILRHVSIQITTSPSQAHTDENHGVLAVIKNQNGTVATDIHEEPALMQIRSGATPVHIAPVTVLRGNIFAVLPMPAIEGTYSIWVSYQGTWYLADLVSDEKPVEVTKIVETEVPPPTPPPPPKLPKEYELQAGGCAVYFHVSSYLELEASDSYIEVLVK